MARILAFDTSASWLSVAIAANGEIRAALSEPCSRGHGERLMPVIERLAREAGVPLDTLDAIAVGTGPGSFTGIRVALAAGKGLAIALARPLIGVDGFRAVFAALPIADSPCLIVIDSRREELFTALVDARGVAIGAPRLARSQELPALTGVRPLRVAGDASAHWPSGDPGVCVVASEPPDARLIARLAAADLAQGTQTPAKPVYLRPPDATPNPQRPRA